MDEKTLLARREIPEHYRAWNRLRAAPSGRRGRGKVGRLLGNRSTVTLRYAGEYAHQWNNDTRTVEYPFAFEKITAHTPPDATVLELGGGLSGLQFTLARTGRRVVNVDPGPARGWPLDAELHRRLGVALRAPVQLHTEVLSNYRPTEPPALLYSVSALEHFSESDLRDTCAAIKELLPVGARVVLTVDLFLDLSPFTGRSENESGTNVDLNGVLSEAGLILTEGDPRELHGFPEFSAEGILRRLDQFYIGRPYPALTQLLVAERSS